jgi:CRISPR-associated protein Cmr4
MFERAVMLYLYTETPLHAGTGRGLEAIDLPIQRERITHYPMVYASSLKGRLRAEAAAHWGETDPRLLSIFGQAEDAGAFGGAISPGDARLLLFPVRSLAGVFAWTTSPSVLQRFVRDTAALNQALPADLQQQIGALALGEGQALVAAADSPVIVGTSGKVVLEEYSYDAVPHALPGALAGWLADRALPESGEYAAWRARLPRHLVILHDEVFRDFARFSTEVITRVRLDTATKTVAPGALWTEESLPAEALLYAPLHAIGTRQNIDARTNTRLGGAALPLSAEAVLNALAGLGLGRMRLGGDETVGRGVVNVRWSAQSTLGRE